MLQLVQRCLDQLRKVIGQVAVGDALKAVVVRVLSHPAIDERPSQVVDGVLLKKVASENKMQ